MNISMDCCTCWAQCIGGVSLLSAVVCETFPHRRPGSERPRSIDVCQDRHIMRATVSPRTIGNRLLAAGFRSPLPLARLRLTQRHRQARLQSSAPRPTRSFRAERPTAQGNGRTVKTSSGGHQSNSCHDLHWWFLRQHRRTKTDTDYKTIIPT